jgi:ketosteroid isomerase-like protein
MNEVEVEKLIRKSYDAFLENDKAILESIFSDDYTFTSPRDDHISKAQFFERCLPGSKLFTSFHIEKVLVDNKDAIVLYKATLKDGTKVNDIEFVKTEDGKISSTEVYFGR